MRPNFILNEGIKREIDGWSVRQAIELDSVPHREDGDVTADMRKSGTANKNRVSNDKIPCTITQGADKRSDERIAQLTQKMVEESMLSDHHASTVPERGNSIGWGNF